MSRRVRAGKSARAAVLGAVLALAVMSGMGPAGASGPPAVDPGRLPADGKPAPPVKTEQKTTCFSTRSVEPSATVPTAQRDMGLEDAWQFTRGAGQTVAVIDTGVSRHPRLPGLVGGGDYVGTSDGTDDCDVHGTVVAGIIAATQRPGDGFAGVAPEARIISLRQSSEAFQEAGKSQQEKEGDTSSGYGDVNTMAAAVVHAANMGATVINISEVACVAGRIADAGLGAALQYATLVKNVVVVSAAGNNDKCKTPNPGPDPLHPGADPWDRVITTVTPAQYDDYVLTVGSVDDNGAPSAFTVPGPWVDVAAPGERITSLDARGGGLATAKMDDKGMPGEFNGTSFASPFVAGTVALVRARYPELTAAQVIKRIEATAHAPAQGWNPSIGFGVVDPYAALTAQVPPNGNAARVAESKQMALPAPEQAPDPTPRNVALIGSAVIVVLLILGVAASLPLRRRFQQRGSHFDVGDTAAPARSGATPS